MPKFPVKDPPRVDRADPAKDMESFARKRRREINAANARMDKALAEIAKRRRVAA